MWVQWRGYFNTCKVRTLNTFGSLPKRYQGLSHEFMPGRTARKPDALMFSIFVPRCELLWPSTHQGKLGFKKLKESCCSGDQCFWANTFNSLAKSRETIGIWNVLIDRLVDLSNQIWVSIIVQWSPESRNIKRLAGSKWYQRPRVCQNEIIDRIHIKLLSVKRNCDLVLATHVNC